MPNKKTPTKKKPKKMDAKLVAAKQKSEVKYTAKKNKVSAKKVREAVKAVGHSRKKVNKKLQDDKLK